MRGERVSGGEEENDDPVPPVSPPPLAHHALLGQPRLHRLDDAPPPLQAKVLGPVQLQPDGRVGAAAAARDVKRRRVVKRQPQQHRALALARLRVKGGPHGGRRVGGQGGQAGRGGPGGSRRGRRDGGRDAGQQGGAAGGGGGRDGMR